ncbi:hypothetical protein SDC9_199770 [bioreactor metagenome]|uniref:Uncharacterized protein n=1 Tax=bioreactor metagenome TaxID=1076179 RepID=A0A645IM50_9ZZZZ
MKGKLVLVFGINAVSGKASSQSVASVVHYGDGAYNVAAVKTSASTV